MKTELAGNRRTFFKQASLFSGLAFLFSLGGPAVAAAKPPSPEPESSGQGYRLTEHIKKYYAAARK